MAQLLPMLEAEFGRRKITTQIKFVFKDNSRAVFDLIDPKDVDSLLQNPPVFAGHSFFPSRPRCVEPLYALEIAVVGLKHVNGAKSFIDQYIRNKYGNDAISASRLVPEMDMYTVVFTYWDTGSRFLTDPFTAFHGTHLASYIGSPTPVLLYLFNSQGFALSGVPSGSGTNPAELRDIRAEMDSFRQEGKAVATSVNAVLAHQDKRFEYLQVQQQHTAAMFANQTSLLMLTMQSSATQNTLFSLQAEQRSIRRQLVGAAGDEQATLEEDLAAVLQQIKIQEDVLRTQQAQQSALQSSTFPALPNPPPSAPTSIPVSETSDTTPTASSSATTVSSNTRKRNSTAKPSAAPPKRANTRQSKAPAEGRIQTVNDGDDDMDDNEVPSTVAASPPALLIRAPNPVNPPNKASSRADLEERRRATCLFAPSPFFRNHSSSRRPCFRRLLFFFFSLCLLRCVSASHPFRVYAINANGLGDVMKQSAIVGGIISSKPHAWVINETKSTRPVASRVSIPGYDIFESVGLPAAGSNRGKWGVIVGVRRDVQALRLDVHETLKGRAIALDLIIPTTSGYGLSHRFIGLYAPWIQGPLRTPPLFGL